MHPVARASNRPRFVPSITAPRQLAAARASGPIHRPGAHRRRPHVPGSYATAPPVLLLDCARVDCVGGLVVASRVPLCRDLRVQIRERVGAVDALAGTDRTPLLPDASALVRSHAPLMRAVLRAPPPHRRLGARQNVTRRERAVPGAMPFARDMRREGLQVVGARRTTPATERTARDFVRPDAPARTGAPDMVVLHQALPPYLHRGSGGQISGSQRTVQLPMPLGHEPSIPRQRDRVAVRCHSRIIERATGVARGFWATSTTFSL